MARERTRERKKEKKGRTCLKKVDARCRSRSSGKWTAGPHSRRNGFDFIVEGLIFLFTERRNFYSRRIKIETFAANFVRLTLFFIRANKALVAITSPAKRNANVSPSLT
jgi:hypothetical protein